MRGSIFPYLEIAIALPNLPLSPRIPLTLSPNILHHASLRREFHLNLITETLYKDKITASFSQTTPSQIQKTCLSRSAEVRHFRLDWFNLPPWNCPFLCLPFLVNLLSVHFGRWTLQNTVNLTVITHPILLIIVTHPITWRSMWRIATWT